MHCYLKSDKHFPGRACLLPSSEKLLKGKVSPGIRQQEPGCEAPKGTWKFPETAKENHFQTLNNDLGSMAAFLCSCVEVGTACGSTRNGQGHFASASPAEAARCLPCHSCPAGRDLVQNNQFQGKGINPYILMDEPTDKGSDANDPFVS